MPNNEKSLKPKAREDRRTYQKPRLERLGTWRELTRQIPGSGFGGGDGG